MNKCMEFMDLISLYVDGEASEIEKKKLEEHIETCESCASFLHAYTGISSTIEADELTPPPSLRENVMAKIKSEPVVLNGQKNDKSTIIRLTVKRYLPLAACVAVIILAMFPLSKQLGGKSSSNEKVALTGASFAPSPSVMIPGAIPDEAPPATSEDIGRVLDQDATADIADANIFAAMGVPDGETVLENTVAPEPPESAPVPAPAENGTGSAELYDGGEYFLTTKAFDVSDYYALVKVDGALPEILKDTEPVADENGLYYAVISAGDADELISLGYGAEYHNPEAELAIVVYVEN